MRRWILLVSLLLVLIGSGALLTSLTPRPASADQTVTVAAADYWFCNASFQGGVCETDVHAGDTVVWNFSQAMEQHTTTECGGSCDGPSMQPVWNSGTIDPGGTFQFRFTQPGTYLYRCQVHPLQMRGRIVVAAVAPAVRPTSPSGQTPSGQTPSANPTATPSSSTLPTSGYGPQSGASGWWWFAALALGSAGLIMVGASALHRRAR